MRRLLAVAAIALTLIMGVVAGGARFVGASATAASATHLIAGGAGPNTTCGGGVGTPC